MPSKPIKHSVAVLIRKGERVLTLLRPDNDDELPGIWGLPAGTLQASETSEDLIGRIGREKLGVELHGISKLADGSQERSRYLLKMELWEAEMAGIPSRGEWKWSKLDLLESGREQGSLCCDLALRTKL